MFRVLPAVLTAGLLLSSSVFAGEFNRKLSIGDPAPSFKDLEGTDGKKHALDEFKDKDVVVVAIICNSCPVAVRYEDRIYVFDAPKCKRIFQENPDRYLDATGDVLEEPR